MSPSLDINLYPLARQAGEDRTDLPGLYIAEPPRRAARNRGTDQLILYLVLAGNAPLSAGKQEQILARLAQTYYKTSGSVTAALRVVAEALNGYLLDRNLKSASTGRQAIGLLTLMTVRENALYLAQSGPVHAYRIAADQTQHIYDLQISGRGLGLSRTTSIRFSQFYLKPNDTLLLATQPSSTWTPATLGGLHGQGPESMRRRLVTRSDLDLDAVLLQARSGSGKMQLLQFAPTAAPATAPALPEDIELEIEPPEQAGDVGKPVEVSSVVGGKQESPQNSAPADVQEQSGPEEHIEIEAQAVEDEEAEARALETEVSQNSVAVEYIKPSPPASAPDEPSVQPSEGDQAASLSEESSAKTPAVSPPVTPTSTTVITSPAPQTAPPPAAASPARKVAPKPKRDLLIPLKKVFSRIAAAFGVTLQAALQLIKTALRRMLPEESLLTIPTSVMVFTAVAVPLVIVAVASVVYIQRGRVSQYELYMQQAREMAVQAQNQPDLLGQHVIWEETLNFLDQAEAYGGVTEESQSLRAQARKVLDGAELARRVDYQPAIIGGLPDSVHISRMTLSDEDLYLLDSNSGSVLRARITNSQKYELDASFQCSPSIPGGLTLGAFIDIAAVPSGHSSGAVLQAMDASGNVVSCFTNQEPKHEVLTAPNTVSSWGNLAAFTLEPDLVSLYALDPDNQAVWVYWGNRFNEEPEFFFGDEVPEIEDVIDLTVDKRDLYLLHADGHMTLCTYSNYNVSPTRCVEPIPYVDSRPGREGRVMSPDSPFTQALTTQPPDPSLYLLQPGSQAVYHFSLRTLNFHRQFMPNNDLGSSPATAFTINPIQRILLLAVGNRVYQANVP